MSNNAETKAKRQKFQGLTQETPKLLRFTVVGQQGGSTVVQHAKAFSAPAAAKLLRESDKENPVTVFGVFKGHVDNLL